MKDRAPSAWDQVAVGGGFCTAYLGCVSVGGPFGIGSLGNGAFGGSPAMAARTLAPADLELNHWSA